MLAGHCPHVNQEVVLFSEKKTTKSHLCQGDLATDHYQSIFLKKKKFGYDFVSAWREIIGKFQLVLRYSVLS